MGILTADMRRVLDEQQLGFIATVTPDGKPNLSPKGTTRAWDDDHLVFADICSPGTIENLRHNPAIEINVVDPFLRKGYRFKGWAEVLSGGALYDDLLAFYRKRGVAQAIREIVLVRVERALAIDSPAYDTGLTEEQVNERWVRYWESLRQGRSGTSTGE
jgi:predicted pyridoxine 5'-phosphate oxidase superfamily flavin-nucleotide-binding protein